VADYWLRLVAANRDRLIRPGDPDLIQPGQTLLLPS
jgi:nucleoid-associated protein YgaU